MTLFSQFTGNQVLARCLAESEHPSQNWRGHCLVFVRTMAGIAAKYGSAAEAWANARKRHTNGTPPAGAAVFWTGGSHGYGHVAVSAGDGKIWTTDIAGPGKVSKEDLGIVKSKWGLRYVGWTEDVNGVTLNIVSPPPRLSLSEVRWAATHNNLMPGSESRIALIMKSLRQLGCGNDSFRNVWQRWQFKLGYTGNDADGVPGPASCAALAERCGYVVVP
jgi:hypothetical protein